MVTFREEDHTYWDVYGRQYESNTTFISRMYGGFDKEKALKVAVTSPSSKYFGWTKREASIEWDRIRDEGSYFHNVVNDGLNNNIAPSGRYEKAALSYINAPWRGKVRQETLLYSEELLMAGTADTLEEVGDTLWLWDIKTSEKLQKEKELKYQLQLCFYKLMAERMYKQPVIIGGIVWYKGLANNPDVTPQRINPRDVSVEFNRLVNIRMKETEAIERLFA